jgi:hypothetical protein
MPQSSCTRSFSSSHRRFIDNEKEGDVSPFTKQPHTAQYKKILEARKKLPVYSQMDEFMKMVSATPMQQRWWRESEPEFLERSMNS